MNFFYFFSIPNSCSAQMKDLLIRLLKKNPKERIPYSELFFISTQQYDKQGGGINYL